MKRSLIKILINVASFIVVVMSGHFVLGQDLTSEKKWDVSIELNNYFLPGEYIGLPVVKADRNKLHLEARYNYEDLETFSGWVGYNFSGGGKLGYTFTPMGGGVIGLSNGLAAGLEMTLTYGKFELYSESENFFDLDTKENDFFYSWTDLSYAPMDWLWVGISGQRTRLYQTDVELQKGFMVGGGYKDWELTSYLYNLGFDDPFVLLAISLSF